MNIAPNAQMLRIREAGEILACSESTVYRLISTGALPAVKMRRIRRIRRSDLEAFIAGRGEASR